MSCGVGESPTVLPWWSTLLTEADAIAGPDAWVRAARRPGSRIPSRRQTANSSAGMGRLIQWP